MKHFLLKVFCVLTLCASFCPFASAEECADELEGRVDYSGQNKSFYVDNIKNVYEIAPPLMKDLMCKVRTYRIDSGSGSAMAGYTMILGENVFEDGFDLSWKYAQNPSIYRSVPDDGYAVNVTPKESVLVDLNGIIGAVFIYISHELGHFMHASLININEYKGITWHSKGPKSIEVQNLRNQLCYDFFGEKCDPDATPLDPIQIHRDLSLHGISTPFGLFDYREDFCETFSLWAFSFVAKEVVLSSEADSFDLLEQFNVTNSVLEQKATFFKGISL